MTRRPVLRWFGKASRPLSSSELTRWAGALYASPTNEPPLRGAIFTIEQLEVHARALASAHHLGRRRDSQRLIKRLADSERLIAHAHALVSEAHAAGRPVPDGALTLVNDQREHSVDVQFGPFAAGRPS